MRLSARATLAAACAVLATIALALIGGAPAQAAISAGPTITTPTNQIMIQYGSAVSPDRNILALPSSGQNNVTFVYADTHTQELVSDPGNDLNGPKDAAFSPDGATLYVTNWNDNAIVIIDVLSATVTGTIPTFASQNIAIAVSPDGTKLVFTDSAPSVTVYDIDNGYADLGRTLTTGQYATNVFFPNNSSAYVVDAFGHIDVITLTYTQVTTDYSFATSYAYGQCAPADLSSIVAVDDANYITKIDPTNGHTLGYLDLGSQAAGLGFCDISPQGTLVVGDWSFGDSGVGHAFVIDLATMTLLDTVTFSDVVYTGSVGVMAGCEVFVASQFTNVGTFQLPQSSCVAPEPEPVLPETGTSASGVDVSVAVASLLIACGAVTLVLARRHARR